MSLTIGQDGGESARSAQQGAPTPRADCHPTGASVAGWGNWVVAKGGGSTGPARRIGDDRFGNLREIRTDPFSALLQLLEATKFATV
jgi:hypothetical protein